MKLHRLVADAFLDNPNNHQFVDHIDRDRLHNDVTNLRWCSRSQNGMNRTKQSKPSSSNYKGVSWKTPNNKWCANIRVDGKLKHIGLFDSEVQAAVAYNNAAIQYFAEFACLNVIPVASIVTDA